MNLISFLPVTTPAYLPQIAQIISALFMADNITRVRSHDNWRKISEERNNARQISVSS